MFRKSRGRGVVRHGQGALAVVALIALGSLGCGAGGDDAADTTASSDAEEPAAAADAAPRVFFVEPADGATVVPPLHLVFGSENFTIEPAGDGAIHSGAGHMHIGLNTECLPAGEVIPTASPWVHFGLGQMEFDLDLPAGEHRIVLQIGDGEHRTLDEPGLCASITVIVE